MSAVRRAVHTSAFGFLLGLGVLVAGAAGVATADPGLSGVAGGSTSSDSGAGATSSSVGTGDRGASNSSDARGVRASSGDGDEEATGRGEAGGAVRRPPARPATPPRAGTRPTVVSISPTEVKRPATTVEPTPVAPRPADPVDPPVVIGRPAENVQYWAARDWGTHNLMTITMVMRQLTGRMVDPQEFVDTALRTDSLYRDGRTMYLGEDANDTVWRDDALELLADAGVDVTGRKYTNSQQQLALKDLKTALQDPQKAVLVNIDGPAAGRNGPADHTVVVLGIDETNGLVYLNDAALPVGGRGNAIPLDRFLAMWNSNYRTFTAQLRSPRPAPGVAAR
ncbi:hypothetical protein ACN27E_19825 [Mycobacterium sp. WMMD1722]|uniref:hypothetical protein n=1 Tax=Mycobacterium sp. WMMD1722 TaxID=3404117 RepID=UPI003BF46A3D